MATKVVCPRVHILRQVWQQVWCVELWSHCVGGFLLWIQTLLSELERESSIEHLLSVSTTEFSHESLWSGRYHLVKTHFRQVEREREKPGRASYSNILGRSQCLYAFHCDHRQLGNQIPTLSHYSSVGHNINKHISPLFWECLMKFASAYCHLPRGWRGRTLCRCWRTTRGWRVLRSVLNPSMKPWKDAGHGGS